MGSEKPPCERGSCESLAGQKDSPDSQDRLAALLQQVLGDNPQALWAISGLSSVLSLLVLHGVSSSAMQCMYSVGIL